MFNTILVPLDGSNLAEAILPHAEDLALGHNSTLIFLQVLELPHLIGLPKGEVYEALPQMTPAEVNQHDKNAHRYLDGLVARMAAKNIKARILVEYGPVVVSIMRAARQENADLIAMASHGRGGMTDIFYGSVAAGILQRIDRPLLIVRAQNP
jgi:nucleotide-binding universal stress UspA family protein